MPKICVYDCSQFGTQQTVPCIHYVQIPTTNTGQLHEHQTNQPPVPPTIDPNQEISEWVEEPGAGLPQPVPQKLKKH